MFSIILLFLLNNNENEPPNVGKRKSFVFEFFPSEVEVSTLSLNFYKKKKKINNVRYEEHLIVV